MRAVIRPRRGMLPTISSSPLHKPMLEPGGTSDRPPWATAAVNIIVLRTQPSVDASVRTSLLGDQRAHAGRADHFVAVGIERLGSLRLPRTIGQRLVRPKVQHTSGHRRPHASLAAPLAADGAVKPGLKRGVAACGAVELLGARVMDQNKTSSCVAFGLLDSARHSLHGGRPGNCERQLRYFRFAALSFLSNPELVTRRTEVERLIFFRRPRADLKVRITHPG